MGLFSGGGVLGDVGGALGLNTGSQSDLLAQSSAAQEELSREAMAEIRPEIEAAQQGQQPFANLGTGIIPRVNRLARQGVQPIGTEAMLNLAVGTPTAPESLAGLAGQQGQDLLSAAGGSQELLGLARAGGGQLGGLAGQGAALGQNLSQQLMGGLGSINLNPDVLNDPSYQAQADEITRNIEKSASAGGATESGGARRAVAREQLLLGNQFKQQDIGNQLAAQNQRFNQLSGALGFGLGAQAQGFGQQALAQGTGFEQLGLAQGQGFNQLGSAQAQGFNQLQSAQQSDLANQLGINSQQFGQVSGLARDSFESSLASQNQKFLQALGVLGAGQQATTQQGQFGIGGAQSIADLLTGIGNSRAAAGISEANLESGAAGGLLGLAGSLGGGALAGGLFS